MKIPIKQLAGLVYASLALLGCQTTTEQVAETSQVRPVSVAEARETVATFKAGETFLPPRRVDDLLGLFENWPDDQSADRAKWVTIVGTDLPIDARPHKRVTTLYERATAARRLGKAGQELSDLRDAVAELEKSRSSGLPLVSPIFEKFVYRDAAWAEFANGSFEKAVLYFRHSAQVDAGTSAFENDVGGWMSLAGLAYVHAYSGNLKLAGESAATARAVIENSDEYDPVRRNSRPDRKTGFMFKTSRSVTAKGMHRNNPWRPIYLGAMRYRLLQAEGRWRDAEPVLRRTIEIFEEKFGDGNARQWAHGREFDWLNIQRVELAANLVRQGRIQEAEVVLRAALRATLKAQGKFSTTTAIALSGFHEILAAQGRYTEAEVLARRVLEIYRELGASSGSRLVGTAQFNLGQALSLQGRWHDAHEEYRAALDDFEPGAHSFLRYFANDPSMLLTRLKAGAVDTVAPLLDKARRRSVENKGPEHYDSLEFAALEAMSLSRRANTAGARQLYAKVVPALISADRQARIGGSQRYDRRWRLLLILEDYIGTLERSARQAETRERARAHAMEAFRVAAFAQSHEVDWALAKSAARNAIQDPELAELIRSEQDAKFQIDALTARLSDALSQPPGQRDRTVANSLKVRLEKLTQSRLTLRAETESRFPDYASLIAPSPPDAMRLKETMANDEALISFFVGEERTYVWAIPGSGEPVFAAVELGSLQLEEIVAKLREALDPNPTTLADIPDFDVALAYRLYRSLYEPVALGWKHAKSLLIAPHGALAYLPPAVMVVKKPDPMTRETLLFAKYRKTLWLGRTHAVSMLPSVTSLATLRDSRRTIDHPREFLGFGDPYFKPQTTAALALRRAQDADQSNKVVQRGTIALRRAPKTRGSLSADLSNLPRLPETAEELRTIARSLGVKANLKVYLGTDASEEQVKAENLSHYKIVAFATHGLVAGDLDGLHQPALALSSPAVTGGREDGLLTMGEVLGLKMNADWVLLSACNTGAGNGAGARAVSGLGRAFFYAGTRSLLVSNWPVHSEATKELMIGLFRRGLSVGDKAEAQRLAMMSLVDAGIYRDTSGRAIFSYAHPIFWAPFSLVGDNRNSPTS